jgi:phosphate:Na+ symporter
VLFSCGAGSRGRGVARAILGLGLVLLSLHLLSVATVPIRDSHLVRELLASLGGMPALAMLVAAGLAFVAHSSLAIVLFAASLAAAGAASSDLSIALVLGANLGAALPPVLEAGAYGPLARRVPLGKMGMCLIGCCVALPFLEPIGSAVAAVSPSPAWLPVNVHLAFNLGLALVFMPLVGPLADVLERVIRAPANDQNGPRYLDTSAFGTPSVALACAARETLRVGDIVETMLVKSLEAMRKEDANLAGEIARLDDQVDRLQEAIKLYLAQLSRDGLDEADSRRATEIVSFAINLEHIGDLVDKGLMELAARKLKNHLRFSSEGLAEIVGLHARTLENLRLALSVFVSRDMALARRLVAMKVEIRNLERSSAERHLERIRSGRLESLQTSTLHLDVVRDLKRINAHVASVAYPILEGAGELSDSRLKATG